MNDPLNTISSAHPLAPLGVRAPNRSCLSHHPLGSLGVRAPNQKEGICRIIAVVGLIGAGKTTATACFVAHGFVRVGFNDVIYQELERRGLQRTETDERMVREDLRNQFGMSVVAERALPVIEGLTSRGKNVVVESLYSWSEYKALKGRFGDDFTVVAIYAPPHLRYERLARRAKRSYTPDIAQSRDYAQIEHLEQAGPIAVANWTIQNTGSKERFTDEINGLIQHLISSKQGTGKA